MHSSLTKIFAKIKCRNMSTFLSKIKVETKVILTL